MSAYVCRHYKIQELVPRALFLEFEKKNQLDLLWMIFDPRTLWTGDALRDRYGPMSVNTWAQGGDREESGFRIWTTTTGARLSQHKFGRAEDLHPKNVTPDEMRMDALKNPEVEPFKLITRIERDTLAWFHYDVGNHDREKLGILVVSG